MDIRRRYWPSGDADRQFEVAAQRALSAFALVGASAGLGVTYINLKYLADFPLPISMGGVLSVIILLCPLWVNAGAHFASRARIVGAICVSTLCAMTLMSGKLVGPTQVFLIPCIATLTLAAGWRTGLVATVCAVATYTWIFLFPSARGEQLASLVELSVFMTALAGSACFIWLGATIFRVQITAAERSLIAAKSEAEAAMRHYRNQAETDNLTGAASRGAFVEYLEYQWETALRSERPLSLIAIDLDHFKRVNDTHGHAAGDRVLVAMVEAAGECLRDQDMIGRVGGEEFLVILDGVCESAAIEIAERIRVRIEAMTVTSSDGVALPVTASLGVATRDGNAAVGFDSPEALRQAADEALYAAKRGGRNQVGVHGRPALGLMLDRMKRSA